MIKALKHCVILRIYIDYDLNTVPKYNACFNVTFLHITYLQYVILKKKNTISSEDSLKCLN